RAADRPRRRRCAPPVPAAPASSTRARPPPPPRRGRATAPPAASTRTHTPAPAKRTRFAAWDDYTRGRPRPKPRAARGRGSVEPWRDRAKRSNGPRGRASELAAERGLAERLTGRARLARLGQIGRRGIVRVRLARGRIE